MTGQRLDHRRMIESDGQQFEIVPADFFAQECSAGPPNSSFFNPALIAASQQLAMLTNFRLSGFSITDLAVEERIVPEKPEHRVRIKQQIDHPM